MMKEIDLHRIDKNSSIRLDNSHNISYSYNLQGPLTQVGRVSAF